MFFPPAILQWTGCLEMGVYRHELLSVLARSMCDPDAYHWGSQCNRAIRIVFPMTDIKRRGKYKSTMYMGVEFSKAAERVRWNILWHDYLVRFVFELQCVIVNKNSLLNGKNVEHFT